MDLNKQSFGARLALAWKVVFNPSEALTLLRSGGQGVVAETRPVPEARKAEKEDYSALLLLSALQREGRLIDFLQQEVSSFSDEEVGAAARVVHQGCSKAMKSLFTLQPARSEPEGASITLSKGFDSERNRLTGQVNERAEYKGTLKHAGWEVTEARLPKLQGGANPKIVAPAEIEVL